MEDLSQYIDFTVTFDLTAYPKLQLKFTGNMPEQYAQATIVYNVKQADGIALDTEPALLTDTVEVLLRLGSDAKYQKGSFRIIAKAKLDDSAGSFTKEFEFQYKHMELDLVEDFDVFTPKLLYRDQTDYDQINYSVTENTILWDVGIGEGDIIGRKTSSTSILDLVYNGNYYSAAYDIFFLRNISYVHDAYPWLVVKDKYTWRIRTRASEPPTVSQMLLSLSLLNKEIMKHSSCGKCSPNDYIYAQSLLSNLLLLISSGQTAIGGNDLVKQFINITKNISQNVTNNIMYMYNYTTVGAGGGATAMLNIDIPETVTEISVGSLKDKTIESIDVDGIGRKVMEGTILDAPVVGGFLFIKSEGKLIYGGELFQDQWVKIKYKL